MTQGLPNQCTASSTANSDYWRSLRQPAWTSPALTVTYTAPDVNLSWNAAADPYPADGVQGYMIVRSPVNAVTVPTDGHTYNAGDALGGGTVLAHVVSNGSPTYSYTDNPTPPLACGDTVYYQVYAYRFGTDNINGNDYNIARGRAYNETTYASAFTGIPDAPVITDVTHTDSYCGQNNGSITITATWVSGVTVEYSINGTDWFTSNVFTDLPPGSYTIYVRIQGFNQCQVAWPTTIVIQDFASPTFTQVDHSDATCGNNNGTITITASGGTAPLEYSIDNGSTWQSSPSFTGLAPGTYNVVIEDANNCEVDWGTPVVINMIPAPTDPTGATVDRNDLCSDDTGDIVLTVVGGSGDEAQWFTGTCGGTSIGTGVTLTIPSPTITTTYFVYWTSAICPNSNCVSVTVNVTDPPSASDAGQPQSLCGVYTTTLAGNQPTSGTGTWTQQSGPGSSSFVNPNLFNTQVTVTVYGSYTYRWTISTGTACPDSFDEVVISFSDQILVTAGSNTPVCTGNSIFLTSSITGAIYSWTGPNGFTSSDQNPVIPNAQLINAGTYTVTVTNIPNGCPSTTDDTDVMMLESPVAPLSATVDPDTVCAGYAGTVHLTANGGNGDQLVWFSDACDGTPIGFGNDIDVPAPSVTTTYYVSWTSTQCGNSGCTTTIVTVLDPPTVADAGTPQTLCGVLNTVMEGNDPVEGTGTWTAISGPGTVYFTDPNAWNTPVTVDAQGVYVMRWTISNGTVCPDSFDEVSVDFGDAIQVVATSNSPLCSGSDLNLTSSIAGATYSWTGPNGFTSTEQNPVLTNVSVAASGTYTVQVTGIPGGCPDTQNSTDVVINQSPAEPTSVNANYTQICAGSPDDLVLTAIGGTGDEVEWFTGSCGGTMIGTGTTITLPAPDVTTTYFAHWTSIDCGNSPCKEITVDVEVPPTPAVAGGDQAVCNNLSTTMDANIPMVGTGQWSLVSGPGSVTYYDQASPTTFLNVSTMGIYVFRWTISTGGICPPRTDDVTVEFSDNVVVTASSNSPICEGDSITLFSSISGADYSWTGPSGFTSALQNPVIYNATAANSGDYSITVSNIPGGCPTSSSVTTVAVSSIPGVPLVSSQNITGSSQEVCSGSIVHYSIVASVPGSFYTWTLSGGGTLQPLGGANYDMNVNWFATGGTYDLTVTETNSSGCTGQPFLLTINIIQSASPSVSISTDNIAVCPGYPVQFTANAVDGGITPLYRWQLNGSDVGTNDSVFILTAPLNNDQVTCEVTSSNLCADPASVTSNPVILTVFDALTVTCSAEDTLCAGTPTTLTPGTGYVSYLWSDGTTGESITVQDAGDYWVLVTDNNGCNGSDTVTLKECLVFPTVYIPNAFTPDGDGSNDRFFIKFSNTSQVSGFEMNIYNRWGQHIFTSNDIGTGWDGTINNNPCMMDIYSYIVTYTIAGEGGGSKQLKGTVALLR